MDFNTPIERRGSHCIKWDQMEARYGVPADDGLAMWVADMDFRMAGVVQRALREQVDHGILGYPDLDTRYREAICWWMKHRHGWQVAPEAIFTTTGLVAGVALCLDAYTEPGDGVVLFTPVYHAFARAIRSAGRRVVECPLVNNAGRYEMDFAAADAAMDGSERMVILCSPHNPGGRVWTREELQGLADFARRHDLILISDEVHHDLVYPGHTHLPMANAAPEAEERLLMLTAPSKTFNIAGLHSGNVIIPDPGLRERFAARMEALAISPNSPGQVATIAAYSPEGAEWVDALMRYLDGNRQVFDAAVNAVPGLASMPLEATYLSWVDFSGTGMAPAEFIARVEQGARIAANHGESFGESGGNFLRFNIAMPRQRIEDAAARLHKAFADLQ